MEQSDRRGFTELIRSLAAGLRGEASTALFQAYWVVLERYPMEHVTAAVHGALRDMDFMPSPGQLAERTRLHARQLELFPPPDKARQLQAAQADEERRIQATWQGHEDELAEMRRKLREGF